MPPVYAALSPIGRDAAATITAFVVDDGGIEFGNRRHDMIQGSSTRRHDNEIVRFGSRRCARHRRLRR